MYKVCTYTKRSFCMCAHAYLWAFLHFNQTHSAVSSNGKPIMVAKSRYLNTNHFTSLHNTIDSSLKVQNIKHQKQTTVNTNNIILCIMEVGHYNVFVVQVLPEVLWCPDQQVLAFHSRKLLVFVIRFWQLPQ